MLIKQLLTCRGDYEKSLRQRRWAAAGLLAVGLVGFACYYLLVPDSGLPDFARGFYMGGGQRPLRRRAGSAVPHPISDDPPPGPAGSQNQGN